ncbi:hypothetical protein TWF506_006435 [Arthrobotrys conoides]|uniref:Uncharacterized protein n=1 Tax=Arthrobotrys conoides TaxID=74498 RepID=A0AAN8RYR8_9PEZI
MRSTDYAEDVMYEYVTNERQRMMVNQEMADISIYGSSTDQNRTESERGPSKWSSSGELSRGESEIGAAKEAYQGVRPGSAAKSGGIRLIAVFN